MSDDVDTANDLALAERDSGIARARAAVAAIGQPECADCGDTIPQARREAMPSAVRCAGCQSGRERR